MATNTSEEKVVLTAVDQFSQVFKNAQRSVDDMKKSVDAVKSGLAALGVVAGAGALVNIYHDTLKATAALDDMAEATGATVETLSAIQRVARVGGQDFDGLTGQIGKMVKGLKQGGEEGTKAGAAFEYLGIKTKDAKGIFRDTGQIVIELAEKLSKYEDGGNKVALVQDALGKGAERYLPLLKDIAEKTDLHATVTARQAAEAEQAEKNMRRLQLVMEDSRRELAIQLTPAIIEFTEKLLAATKASGGLISGLATMNRAQTGDIPARLKEINQELDNPSFLDRAKNLYTGGLSGKLRQGQLIQEREYLERLQANRMAELGRGLEEDASGNVQPASAKPRLAYQSPKKESEKLSPYDRAELEMRQAIAKAQFGDSETYTTQLAIQAGKYGELNEAQKSRLIQLAAERDLQKADADLKREIGQIIEANGAKELRAAEERRQVLDEYRNLAMSQEEIENESYKRRLEQLKSYTDEELAAVGGRQAIEQQMEGDHMARLRQIRARGLNSIADFNKATWEEQTAAVVGELSNMTSGVAQHNRKLFELNKLAATANAIISTAAGVAKAIEVYPPPLSFVMAAAQAAVGAVQIATIQSTQFGSTTAPSASATPAPAVTPIAASGAASPQASPQTTVIHFHGSQSEAEVIRRFVEALNENQRDGGRFFVQA